MATLSKHGAFIKVSNLRFDIAYCEDGKILRNYGNGWKLHAKLKPGVNWKEYAQRQADNIKALPGEYQRFRSMLFRMGKPLKARTIIIAALELLSDDIDGLYSELGDMGLHYGFDELQALADAFKAWNECKKVIPVSK